MVRYILVLLILVAGPARAELSSLFSAGRSGDVTTSSAMPASLFEGPRMGMFAPLPDRPTVSTRSSPTRLAPALVPTGRTQVDQLLSLIARAEAGPAGYDAINYGARIRTSRPPSQMTLGEIYTWIDATPGQPHAIGRYQFIPDTLRRVARVRGFGPETQFTPGVQDVLALVLLEDAGLERFQRGEMDRVVFMHNLAQIWAGLPLPNGKSYYDGYAGNSATMTWAAFSGGMRAIWGG